ncbi:MAG: hypothetical protein H6573_28830 [Lewinellaceae bacterium]|nr:hypothetical protein [Phaeodactylibacter sp.]MCB9351471.1 hypothetical protein [Lewinellaceae bacterium]
MANEDQILDAPEEQEGGPRDDDNLNMGLQVLSFCIPLAGAIIYFSTDRQRYPHKAQQACYAALWGMGISLLLNILTVLLEGM